MKRRTSSQRLSREIWLNKALDVLSQEGQAGLRIQGLCTALGVSRGSFYWHFEDRDDFIHALLDYWHAEYTVTATEFVAQEGGTAVERLAKIVRFVHDRNLTRYDLVIRSWAASDRKVAKSLRKTDQFRLSFLESLFREIGFSGIEVEIRGRTCLSFMTLENTMFKRLDRKYRADLIDELLAFLLRK